jgi:predicted nucleic acid-binding protein
VRLVIADTGPIHYLILIGHINILPKLFERVVIPSIVLAELSHELAPASVQRWAAAAPAWLEVAESPAVTLSAGIHKGEATLSHWPVDSVPTCC